MTQTKLQPTLRGPRRFAAQIESPLKGVSNEAWNRFVMVMGSRSTNSISDSGGLGAYDIRPRRLAELDYATRLTRKVNAKGRHIYECVFCLPWTQARFLANPLAQYVAFSRSMLLYHTAMQSGELHKPEGLSMAGALAVAHAGGRGALKSWPKLFKDTQAQYERVCKFF